MTHTLTYATTELSGLGARLEQLAGELRSDGRLAHVDKYDVVEASVIDALGDFAADWENRREELAGNVEALGKLAGEAARTFGQADDELAAKALEILQESRR